MRNLFHVSIIVLFFNVIIAGCSKNEESARDQDMTANKQAGAVGYTAPDGWVHETPTSDMRKDQFRLPGVDGFADGELAVFFFPGTGGSVDANLSRWYRQFKQPDGRLTDELAESKKIDVNGLPVTITFVTGTFMKSKSTMMMGGPVEELKDYAMLAAIVETANGPWFFKATGPENTIEHWRQTFNEFVQSFKIVKVTS